MTTTWQARVRDAIRAAGYADLDQLLEREPSSTYTQLAERVGPEVLPVQISELQLTDAKARGVERFARAVRDVLYRSLREQLPLGWSGSAPRAELDPQFQNGLAFTLWRTHLYRFELPESLTDAIEASVSAAASPGWTPASAADPVLLEAFRSAWPQPS